MVEVDDGVTVETRLEQEFNGLSWRTLKREDLDADGDLDEERTYTYTANWQLIEERVDKDIDSDLDKRVQYVWGLRYIDDCLMHRADLDNNGEYDDTNENTWYHMTDGMFSTVALLDRAANLVERVSYDSYGKARHHRGGDLDGDGKVDGSDQGDLMGVWDTVITDSGYRGDADFNRDGEIDGNDLGSLFGFWGAALPAGQISFTTTGGPDNSIGWDGYVFNPATGDYLVRYRTYMPTLGRWMERDPIGYRDSTSRYLFGSAAPDVFTDALGLSSHPAAGLAPHSPSSPGPLFPQAPAPHIPISSPVSPKEWGPRPPEAPAPTPAIPVNPDLNDPLKGCGVRYLKRGWFSDASAWFPHGWLEVPYPSGRKRGYGFYPTGLQTAPLGPWPGQWRSPTATPYGIPYLLPEIVPISDTPTTPPSRTLPLRRRQGSTLTCAQIRACLETWRPVLPYHPILNNCYDVVERAMGDCDLEIDRPLMVPVLPSYDQPPKSPREWPRGPKW